jgi:hypothetical protein
MLALGGCNLTVHSFAGAVISMTLAGAPVTPAGQHYELWARNGNDDVIRLPGIVEVQDPRDPRTSERLLPYGFFIRPAMTMDDPCMIDGLGNLLVTANAYPAPTDFAGVSQSPDEQAEAVRSHIADITATSSCDGSGEDPRYHCGRQASTVLGLFPYEIVTDAGLATMIAPTMPPVPFAAAAADRLAACQSYWANPLAYTPNPLQLSAPAHGAVWGYVTYVTLSPPAGYQSIRIDVPVDLRGLRELFITVEPDQVDPLHRGPVLLDGTPQVGGQGVVHFELQPPPGAAVPVAGSATVYTDLAQAPDLF